MMAIATLRKKKEDELPYLCFTATSANSAMRLNKIGEPYAISLEVSRNKKSWTKYKWTWIDESDHSQGATGDTITLLNIGDQIYWRECTSDDGPKGLFSIDGSNYFHFESEQVFNCSGNIMSLLDNTLTSTVVPTCAFYNLFRPDLGQNFDILTAPKLPAGIVRSQGYRYMFLGTHIASIKFDCVELGSSACASVCRQCNNLTSMEVSHTDWGTNRWTYFLHKVTTKGTLVCPAALDTINFPSNVIIPETWTIKKKGYYSNNKFYNDAGLTTESILIAGEYYIDIPTKDEYYYNGTDLILWGGPTS